jgi:2-keto-3-deoxy-6-phosphogluconate aldolase
MSLALTERLAADGIVAIVRVASPDGVVGACRALCPGGVRAVEIRGTV